jgi:Bacterial antitoxin of type II TA system, VapB
MRTTLDIDDDLLAAAKEISRLQGQTAGQVVSALLRRALAGGAAAGGPPVGRAQATVGAFRPFSSRGSPVTNAAIDALRDGEGA